MLRWCAGSWYVLCGAVLFIFFFKQKTAYEMRISDWSSDVCSSDLRAGRRAGRRKGTYLLSCVPRRTGRHRRQLQGAGRHSEGTARQAGAGLAGKRRVEDRGAGVSVDRWRWSTKQGVRRSQARAPLCTPRSEERRVGKEGVSTGRSRGAPAQ